MLADSSTMKEEKQKKKNVSESSETSDKEDEEDSNKVSEGNSGDEEYNFNKTKKKTKQMLAKKVFTPGAQSYDHSDDSSLSDQSSLYSQFYCLVKTLLNISSFKLNYYFQ